MRYRERVASALRHGRAWNHPKPRDIDT